jgi:hypothetical protein
MFLLVMLTNAPRWANPYPIARETPPLPKIKALVLSNGFSAVESFVMASVKQSIEAR